MHYSYRKRERMHPFAHVAQPENDEVNEIRVREHVNRNELEALVRIHQAEIFRYLCYLGAEDRSLAEDLVQDVFLAAWRSRSAPGAEDVRRQAAWLRGIARNLFYAWCRRERKSRPLDESTLARAESLWAAEFLREGDGFDFVEALRKCLNRLQEKQRRFLDLRYTQNRSRADMAELLHMTEDGIKSALQRIRALLADCIDQRLRSEQT